ncbi:MAG TPA: shikimate dehydrogenase [Candidatus Nanopelagicales bacterium]|nr:shikimate dehydrogenase [Candidatus Nanopelagicales bacterium]
MPADGGPAGPVRRAAVLGHPIAHTLSPVLHRAAWAGLGLPWEYSVVDCTEADLAAYVASRDASWVGLSLTMPLKQAVLPLLDEADDLVTATGAANTLLLDGGRRRGANTDVEGIEAVLAEQQAPHGTAAALLGGGATARSAVAALARYGATEVTAYVRRPEAGEELVATGAAVGIPVVALPWSRAEGGLAASVVVTTVPRGTADSLAAAVPSAPGVLLDVVYDPWPTAIAAAWSARGGRVASGLGMLLHQAVGQVRLMTGREPSVDAMREALDAAAARR